MRLAVYGGSFDPPHLGHVAAAASACAALSPDELLIIPAADPPHKELDPDGATGGERLALCELAFAGLHNCRVSDMELRRGGVSYTSDTLALLREKYPEAEPYLLVGTDMLLSFTRWHEFRAILKSAALAVFARRDGDGAAIAAAAETLRREYGAKIVFVPHEPLPAASTDIRAALPEGGGRELLSDAVYSRIIKLRLYNAQPDPDWLREKARPMYAEKRLPHAHGCEAEAVRLAQRWGADVSQARESAILHDITKKMSLEEQLILCEKYGILNDNVENASPNLLHGKTAAALAADEFGSPAEVCSAIRWHTTGRPGMTLLEMVLYMADYIEPNRHFDGVETLRELAYGDLDAAMALGLEMSIEDLKHRGLQVHGDTVAALDDLRGGIIRI